MHIWFLWLFVQTLTTEWKFPLHLYVIDGRQTLVNFHLFRLSMSRDSSVMKKAKEQEAASERTVELNRGFYVGEAATRAGILCTDLELLGVPVLSLYLAPSSPDIAQWKNRFSSRQILENKKLENCRLVSLLRLHNRRKNAFSFGCELKWIDKWHNSSMSVTTENLLRESRKL